MQKQQECSLLFHVEEVVTHVVLFRGAEEIGRVCIEPNRELLEKLLPAIDALLLEHTLLPSNIADIKIESELPDGYSSRRIAETIATVWHRFGS